MAKYPLPVFHFRVEWSGDTGGNSIAFSEVSGLNVETQVIEYRDGSMLQLWNNALEELRTADHWIIAGYSLPNEDFAIRSLFLRALNGKTTKPKITVIQKGVIDFPKYEQFFGKDNFIPFKEGIEKYQFR